MDGGYIGNHVRAARKLRGLATRADLSALIDKPRFGPAVIGQIERGERAVADHEIDWLAQALELPRGYFEDTQPAETIENRLDAIERRVTDQLAEHARKVEAYLQRQDEVLERIEKAIARQDGATTETEEARQGLLKAAEAASRVYEDAAQRLAEARDTPAT
jgi:transcriptional regulator with XRE-family HTH domain